MDIYFIISYSYFLFLVCMFISKKHNNLIGSNYLSSNIVKIIMMVQKCHCMHKKNLQVVNKV